MVLPGAQADFVLGEDLVRAITPMWPGSSYSLLSKVGETGGERRSCEGIVDVHRAGLRVNSENGLFANIHSESTTGTTCRRVANDPTRNNLRVYEFT